MLVSLLLLSLTEYKEDYKMNKSAFIFMGKKKKEIELNPEYVNVVDVSLGFCTARGCYSC